MRVGGTGVGPGEDIEIQWVDDAVAIAKTEAQRTGGTPCHERIYSMKCSP